jgi:hypothetical protein
LKTSLKELARIQTGMFGQPTARGEVVYLQAKHFDEDGAISTVLHPDLKNGTQISKHLLRPDDVLFAAKGTKNFATLYKVPNQPAVASTTFFVIRDINEDLLPQYLVWLLNHPTSQSYLKRGAIGSSIASISKTVLEDLKLIVPPVHIQNRILELARLSKRENSLLLKLAELRQEKIQKQIIHTLNKI